MLKAAALVPENSVLHDIALSNAADFYIHTNNNEQAAALFKKCVAQNRNDVHSIMALGTIAMKNDHDHASAEKLFKLANKYYQLPDPLFKLYQLGQQRKDKNMEKKFAEQFASVARNAVYGKMYTKYFIELYTGILNQPELAEKIAAEELTNRSTPQTAAWYAWTLFNNKKTIEAEKVYKESVAGKPLEGLELFYMGKLMTGLKRTRTAHAFFKAAEENKFDLSPRMTDELKKLL
jgi:tetratricopeptide (TPR) repeat protein